MFSPSRNKWMDGPLCSFQRHREVFLRYAFPRLDVSSPDRMYIRMRVKCSVTAIRYAMRYVQFSCVIKSRVTQTAYTYIIHAATPSTAAFAIAHPRSFCSSRLYFSSCVLFSFSVYSTPRLISHEQNARSTNVLIVCPRTYTGTRQFHRPDKICLRNIYHRHRATTLAIVPCQVS